MLLNERHRTNEVFASFFLNESANKQDEFGIARDVDCVEPVTIDSGVMEVEFGLWKPCIQGGIANEFGDAYKGCGLFQQSFSVPQEVVSGAAFAEGVVAGGDIEAMQRDDQWYVEFSGNGQRLHGVDCEMGMNDGGVGGTQAADEISFHRDLSIEAGGELIGEFIAIAKQYVGLRILQAWVGAAQSNHHGTIAAQARGLFHDEGLAWSEKAFAKYKSGVHKGLSETAARGMSRWASGVIAAGVAGETLWRSGCDADPVMLYGERRPPIQLHAGPREWFRPKVSIARPHKRRS